MPVMINFLAFMFFVTFTEHSSVHIPYLNSFLADLNNGRAYGTSLSACISFSKLLITDWSSK